jgi:hypothetical protein
MSALFDKLKSVAQKERFLSNRAVRHITQIAGPLGLYDPEQAREIDDDVPPLALDDLFAEERGAKNFDWLNPVDSSLTGGVPTDWWLDSEYRSEQLDGGLDPEIIKYIVLKLSSASVERPLTPAEQATKRMLESAQLDQELIEQQFHHELVNLMTSR